MSRRTLALKKPDVKPKRKSRNRKRHKNLKLWHKDNEQSKSKIKKPKRQRRLMINLLNNNSMKSRKNLMISRLSRMNKHVWRNRSQSNNRKSNSVFSRINNFSSTNSISRKTWREMLSSINSKNQSNKSEMRSLSKQKKQSKRNSQNKRELSKLSKRELGLKKRELGLNKRKKLKGFIKSKRDNEQQKRISKCKSINNCLAISRILKTSLSRRISKS